ncbi:MAG: DUF6770 family protein [Bacteroidota bacterium]
MKTSLSKLFMVAALMIAGLTLTGYAQNKELKISPLRFAGVHALSPLQGESQAYMVLHGAPGGEWNYHLYDYLLDEIKEGSLETPKHSHFNMMTSNGEHTLMSFVNNAFSQSLTYVVLDRHGNEVARTIRTDATMLRRGDQFFPTVYNHPESGFLIVQTLGKGRNAGYTVEHVDHNLNTLWSLPFTSPRGHAHVYDLVTSNSRAYILEATEKMGRTLNARLHSIDLASASHIYTMELGDGEHSFFPTALLPTADNTLAMAGTYFRGEKIRGKNTRGLFFLNVNPDGSTAGMQIHPWATLGSTLRTPVPDWFFRVMPDVYIHALEQYQDGSFMAVAELYRYSGEVTSEDDRGKKEQYHRIRLLDFMLLGFEGSGNILYTERIQKPHVVLKLDSKFTTGSNALAENAGKGPLRRAKAMKSAGAFAYRFHQLSGNNFNLAFTSYENKVHYGYFMDLNNNFDATRVELSHAKPSFISYMQIIDVTSGQNGFGFILSELNTRSFDDSEAYWRGMLPSGKGTMLTYEYMPFTGKLQLNLVNLSTQAHTITR